MDNSDWRTSLPEGWRPLFDRLVVDLAEAVPEAVIDDAKQKFGSLRVYLKRSSLAAEELIDAASRASQRTCEACGAPGQLTVTPDRYYGTLCERHRGSAEVADANPVIASFRIGGDGSLSEVDRS